MYFKKFHHPVNFSFPASWKDGRFAIGKRRFEAAVKDLGDEVFRIDVAGPWEGHHSQAVLSAPRRGGGSRGSVGFDAEGTLRIADAKGVLLKGLRKRSLGICGSAWLLQFEPPKDAWSCYGMGEKGIGMDRAGKATKFWNTDVWADFAWDEVRRGVADPAYASVPWFIIRQGERYCGILVNNPQAVFLATDPRFRFGSQDKDARLDLASNCFVGAPDGTPELYVILGPDLPSLIRRLQRLVGPTPLPPLWALGHHQCRWGYASRRDLEELDRGFRKHRIPTDGLWLDIDYMDGYRVFSFAKKHWPHPAKDLASLAKKGRKVVAILDPGVKTDPGYAVYRDGLKKNVFCLTREGRPYVGFVWPGDTAFPDFSLPEVRRWWAGHVEGFARTGMAGAWLDMNDPATGKVELGDMRFRHGRLPHETYHNQYALGMAQASREGFLAARPDERPFLLSRSGFISSSRYTALWTGDNMSNWENLRKSVEVTLNLALSGIPFNGPDVPGFGLNPTPALAAAWYKAGFLFPFFRNHSNTDNIRQEPWTFPPRVLAVIRRCIALRYRLLPYLYQLFVRQEECGEAIMRPLFHDFADQRGLELGGIDDQFLVGPAIMQAPLLDEGLTTRRAVLPAGWWYDASAGAWARGGRRVQADGRGQATPMWLREGQVIPLAPKAVSGQDMDLSDIELHCVLRPGSQGEVEYVADDGISFAYRRGERTRVRLAVSLSRGGELRLRVMEATRGWKPLRVRAVAYAACTRVVLASEGRETVLPMTSFRCQLAGRSLALRASHPFRIG